MYGITLGEDHTTISSFHILVTQHEFLVHKFTTFKTYSCDDKLFNADFHLFGMLGSV